MSVLDRVGSGLQSRVAAVTERFPRSLPTLRYRRARVTVRTDPTVPGVLLRIVCVALALGCLLVAGAGATLVVLGGLLALVLLVRPGGVSAVIMVGFVAVVYAAGGDASTPGPGLTLLLGTHLLVQLAALLGGTGWSVRVELRALLVPAPRFLVVQLAAQLLALLGTGLSRGRLELPWLAAAAVVALGALVLWLAPRLAAAPTDRDAPE